MTIPDKLFFAPQKDYSGGFSIPWIDPALSIKYVWIEEVLSEDGPMEESSHIEFLGNEK